jgi:cellulose synthase/poly-beta-1,6-N-acetylglucosamine synthase-like glycosyltransferase
MTPLTILYGLLLLFHGFASLLLFLYGINYYLMLYLHRRARVRMQQQDEAVWHAWKAHPPPLPRVTVQLPLYNERYVIQRLLEAVTALQYPKALLDIQVLDDSTDGTTAMAARLVERYRRAGFDITLCHRAQRHGYKAGALQEGLATARGTFIAIFDADFVPEPDFLMRTLPFLQDPAIAMVQTRWGHINGDYSVLSRAQAYGLNGHFWVEQAARCWSGLFMSFNGSGGVWRRQAIDDAGGWQADTLTEDLDLSYRAQLRGWRLKFLPQVVCPAEVPVHMSALKNQQHRWAKGSIQTARKLIPRLLRADVPLFTKYQAVCYLTNYLVYPLMLFVALTSSLPVWFEVEATVPKMPWPVALGLSLATFGPLSMYLYAHRYLYTDWRRRLWAFPFLLIFGTGLALNNTRAICEAFGRRHSVFVRTPKYGIEHASDTWVGKRYRVPFPWLSLAESLLAVYCAYGIYSFMQQQDTYLINPFALLFTLGFAAVAGCSLWESWQRRRPAHVPRHSPGWAPSSAPVQDRHMAQRQQI